MNNNEKRFDSYAFTATNEEDFIAEVKEMEKNSTWIPGIPRTALKVLPLDAPMFVQEAVDKYGLDPELAMDTAMNFKTGGYGTNLLVQYHDNVWCLRDTGRQTLYTSAGQLGPANSNMVQKEAFRCLAASLNLGLKYAKGNAILLVRYGKLSALHSGASDGYEVMFISELLDIAKKKLEARFGTPVFKSGVNYHSYTSAVWELPDVRDEIISRYQAALSQAVSRNHAINWMPVVKFTSSDTATSSATLMPQFQPANGGTPFCIGKGIRVEHQVRTSGAKYGLEKFEEEAGRLYSLFEDGAEFMQRMGETEIANPVNCLVGICIALKIPRKYADPAREEIEDFAESTPRMSMLDIYLSLSQIPAHAKLAGASENKILDLEETVAKALYMDWRDFDVGGTVAWK